ncbi:MAG: FAD-binding oxidoreductase, partial [Melioribacteraceae bacterium]|nr:FAD-binding oxidoreductase [Melioribacteraceae bacterium]
MADLYKKLFIELSKLIPSERLFNDELQTFAYGTDASFYRLTPKLVVKIISEDEAVFVIKKCNEFEVPITFRASGTSLSGQSISDSVLLVADRSWNQLKVSSVLPAITLQPAVLGGRANQQLAKLNQKIGPDPASINSATVAGIVSNNASGMTSGVINNSYNTISDMRIVFANGSVLNTADGEDKIKFIEENRALVVELLSIAWDINKEPAVSERIKNKYKIKNTTGYSINSFVDFKDPIEIIKHLMVGSEGTLGFISQITLKTVPTLPFKASSLLLFNDVKTACSIIPKLKELPIDAAEIMDRAALKSVENK